MPKPAQVSSEETRRALEGNRIAFFSRMAGTRGGRLESDSAGIRMTSGVPFPIFNWVLRTSLPESELDDWIQSNRAHFRTAGVPFYWAVGPADRPTRLPERLRELGFEAAWSPAMAVTLEDLPPVLNPDRLRIVPVTSSEELRTFARTLNSGDFRAPPEVERAIPDLLRPSLSASGPEPNLRCFVGYLDGVAVATSARFLSDGVVGIYGVATVSEARGRGFGSSMTLAALRDGQSLGYDVGVLIATRLGEPVYRRLGFQELYRVGEFRAP